MAMLGGLILKRRLKWIFAWGLGLGVARFVACAFDIKAGLLAGIVLHGCSFTLVFITAQIYVDQRVEPAWRARAQALISLMSSGLGNLAGYLGTGWWFSVCATETPGQWRGFWLGLAAAVAMVLVYFMLAYHGKASEKASTTLQVEG